MEVKSIVFRHSKGVMARAAAGPSTCRLHRAALRCKVGPNGSKPLWIYATHLNHMDGGGARREEANAIVVDMQELGQQAPVLVVADFNQPRQCDYSPKEWQAICRSAAERQEPENDGVAEAFEASGLKCSIDLSNSSE